MKNLKEDDSSPLGPYFSDGQRRVDYVLAYHIQKSSSIRHQSSMFGGNSFIRRLRRSLSKRSSRAHLQPKEDPEIAAQEQRTDYHEDDKRFRREEFEENLLETGLELEKDERVSGAGGRGGRRKCLYKKSNPTSGQRFKQSALGWRYLNITSSNSSNNRTELLT